MSDASIPSLKITDLSEDIHCSTKLKFHTVGIKWTIENYDVVCKTVKILVSAKFPEGERGSQKWYIEFKPLKITPDSEEIQKINIKRTFMGDLYVDTLLCLETESKQMYNQTYACELQDNDHIIYSPSVKEIYDKLLKNETADKSLIITCKIRIFDNAQPKAETVSRKTRSEVFQAMFTNEMNEKSNSFVEIKDLTPEVIEKMLHFIYTDKVVDEDLKEFAPELLGTAEKYNLQRLKEMCILSLYENMSVQNVLNTLQVADIYSISNLKKEALKFLVSHRQVVICQDEFQTLIVERPHLVVEMFRMNIQDNIPETPSYETPKINAKRLRDIMAVR